MDHVDHFPEFVNCHWDHPCENADHQVFCVLIISFCQERGLGHKRGPRTVSKLPQRDNKIAKALDGKGEKKQRNCLEPLQASLMKQSANMQN